MARVLFLFLDGVGIGPSDPRVNPFFRASLPVLSSALGGCLPSLKQPEASGPLGKSFPLDACLGVAGIPQSGTGQVALLTGRNAPNLFGRHFGPWPPVRLRARLESENFIVRAAGVGASVVFANAYPVGYPEGRSSKRVAAVTLAALTAGLMDRDHRALAHGRAVATEIRNDIWIDYLGYGQLPEVSEEEAGENLGRIAGEADLTIYAHYLTDTAGHRGGMQGAVAALELVDRFVGGVLRTLPPETLLLIASDHGNIEDTTSGHTRNPALCLALGRRPAGPVRPSRLTDIAQFVLTELAM